MISLTRKSSGYCPPPHRAALSAVAPARPPRVLSSRCTPRNAWCSERMFSGDGPLPFGIMALPFQATPLAQDIGPPAGSPSSSGVSSPLPFGIVAALDDPLLSGPSKGSTSMPAIPTTRPGIVAVLDDPLISGPSREPTTPPATSTTESRPSSTTRLLAGPQGSPRQ